MNSPYYPTITLGGTSAEALVEQEQAVVTAADALLRAMGDATPHGRDYPLHDLARQRHSFAVNAVATIRNEAEARAIYASERVK